ncbi:MAG: aldehyde dehydrogenase family protein [Candidatus Thermoplasmatota archaeon]|nr:aldehyde dehydrogenase family protein [Candidatus Thermoplasmatota archaeon]
MSERSEVHLDFIDGEWVESEGGETFEVRDPADVEKIRGRFQSSTQGDVDRAVDAAVEARSKWKNTPGPECGKILRKTGELMAESKEELTKILTIEEGKTLSEAGGEVQRSIDIFYYYAEKARELKGEMKASSKKDRDIYTLKEPLGVVGLITPWNYPSAIPAWKLAPALAAGNSAIIKPASLAPHSCKKIIECLEKAGIPDGVVNFVTGSGSEVGEAVVTHKEIDAVSFTGSREVGQSVYQKASEDGKRVQTEMGGKNPTLVMEDAEIEKAVNMISNGAFGVTGQACTATSRALVHKDIYDKFVEKMKEKARSIEVGPGVKDTNMGPQVSEGQLEGTLNHIESGKKEGAKLVCGGNKLKGGEYSDGHYVEPTVFKDVRPEMKIAQEEIFGPVLSIIKVNDYEEAVQVANYIDYGLSASIVTEDLSKAHRFIEDIESGVAKVNEKTTGLELHVPFGGFKDSSSETWREQGDAGLDFYTISKTVYLNY